MDVFFLHVEGFFLPLDGNRREITANTLLHFHFVRFWKRGLADGDSDDEFEPPTALAAYRGRPEVCDLAHLFVICPSGERSGWLPVNAENARSFRPATAASSDRAPKEAEERPPYASEGAEIHLAEFRSGHSRSPENSLARPVLPVRSGRKPRHERPRPRTSRFAILRPSGSSQWIAFGPASAFLSLK